MRDYFMRAAVDSSGSSQTVIAGLKKGDQLKFVREPNNPDDKYTVRIVTMTGENVGYVSRIYSQRISLSIAYGFKYKVLVSAVKKPGLGSKQMGVDLQILYEVPDLSKIKRRKKSSN